ncbi:MAG TPA: helix-turn-helix transcriptional regulator [Clostridiales bacterium]|nr:helix-turn-helix transcriptional regulator [Clostridiales bacterium]
MINFKYIYINNYKTIVKVPPHLHNCYELVYFHSGSGESGYVNLESFNYQSENYIKYYNNFNISNLEFKFSPGTFIIYSPYALHNEIHFDPSKITAIGFTIDKNLEYEFNTKRYNDFDSLIHKYIMDIETEYLNRNFNYIKMIEVLIFQLLTHLKRLDNNPQSTSIQFAKAYIDQYFMTDIKLYKLAKQSGYCTDYFRIRFKEEYGCAPKAYILKKRLEYAKHQIATSDLSLNIIATNCGFTEYNQFVAFFKKFENISPSAYRKMIKNNTNAN